MTFAEAREAGDLVKALTELEQDRDALEEYAKRSSDTVEMSFWDDENTAISTGTMIPVKTAVLILDGVRATIQARLAELGVDA